MKTGNNILIISYFNMAATAALILLFSYTAISKLQDISHFESQMLNQPIPELAALILVWLVPGLELVIVAMLMVRKTRTIGLIASSIIMAIFTAYVAIVLLGAFDNIPCSCGGVLESMSWESHLIFNALFLAIAFFSAVMSRQINRRASSI